jgi:hypothetical protein
VLLKQTLNAATDRFSGNSSVVITMPNSNGEMERFQMFEASNFEPTLQVPPSFAQYTQGRGKTRHDLTTPGAGSPNVALLQVIFPLTLYL